MASIPSFVTPGALISGDPNLSPGQGTLRTEGGIIATMTGTPSLEGDVISIPSGDLSDIRPAIGDHVIGRVTKVYEKSVELALVQIEGRPHRSALPQDLALELRVMKIVDKFLHHAVDGLRRRDIVRAKVVKTDPLVAVELRGHEGCGVLHALCPDCGSRLDPASGLEADRNMLCGTCGHTGYRVLSDDYVTGVEGLDSLSSLNAEGERWGSAPRPDSRLDHQHEVHGPSRTTAPTGALATISDSPEKAAVVVDDESAPGAVDSSWVDWIEA